MTAMLNAFELDNPSDSSTVTYHEFGAQSIVDTTDLLLVIILDCDNIFWDR